MSYRKRKFEAVRGNAVKALSFTESYSLTADTATMHPTSGRSVRISLSDSGAKRRKEGTGHPVFTGHVRCERCFLPGLSIECNSLPRASEVKAARSELNTTVVSQDMVGLLDMLKQTC